MRSVTDSFALAHSIAQEPILISELVRIACVAITLSGMEQVMSASALTDEQLRALNEKLKQAEADSRAAYARGISGERCMGIDFFTMTPEKLAPVLGTSSGNGPQRIGITLYRLTGLGDSDFRFYLETLEKMIAASQQPFPEGLKQTRAAAKQVEEAFNSPLGRLRIISRMVLPALQKAFEKETRILAQSQAAQTAVAIERYRLAHHDALPESLAALTPAFLERVPSDPFDGQPLEFERLPKGYRVTCPGATLDANNPKDKKGNPKPVGFTVAR